MVKIFKRRDGIKRKGSALLIVLGFLSFMIISAVAFAIYMRVERQASSNYRHASSARHLLNAALYRAIDEIDSELRATNIKGVPNKRKFPDWPGRVRNSAVVSSDDNSADARVLTLDALSYIPAILANDVRAHAVKPINPGTTKTYQGPKWRKLSMPDRNMQGDPAYGEAVVGRYAYSCVNISDMLNVNACKATVRDADRYRVSLAHLFSSQSARKNFDDNVKTDRRYSTLSDFYACMQKRGDSTFGSPYHHYLSQGDDIDFDYATKHILVTDGMAKAEPADQSAFNLKNGVFQSSLNADPPVLKGEFLTALNSALANSSANFSGSYRTAVFPYLLADYLDADNIPKALDVPSVELAPMVCKIELTPQTFNIFESREEAAGEGVPKKTIISINIMKLPPQLFGSVKTIYPFLRTDYRNNIATSFEVDVNAFLRIHSEGPGAAGPCSMAPGGPSPGDGYFVAYKNTPSANKFTPSANVRSGDSPYNVQPVNLEIVPLPGMPNSLDIWNSLDGGTSMDPRFPVGNEVRITLYITFLGIKESGSDAYVDAVPAFKPVPPTGSDAALQTRFVAPMSPHKLYFETTPSTPLVDGFDVAQALNLKWTGLETPDPRFNWKISNWVQNNDPVNLTDNASTRAFLDEPDTGRDTDIFMSVSNAEEMYSPGELGFIIRPFSYRPMAGPPVNFNDQVNALEQCEDRDAMFRTFRLYDHGDPAIAANTRRHDDLYEWFYSSNPDGSFDGARVNPLSDIPLVLGAAAEAIPFDYWLVDQITEEARQSNPDFSGWNDKNFSELLKGTSWAHFTNGWFHCLLNARNNTEINTKLEQNIRHVYSSNKYFGWYSEAASLKEALNPVEKPTAAGVSYPITLSQELYGVDRKMLYSYTLESFSDRQQLFLYIINAEATAASFGDSVQSLAGGRAIALVWRDPYPAREKPSADPVDRSDMYGDLISPWHQYYIGQNDRKYKNTDSDPDSLMRDKKHYYDHKILFFKYLDR